MTGATRRPVRQLRPPRLHVAAIGVFFCMAMVAACRTAQDSTAQWRSRCARNSEVCFSRTLKFIGRLHSRIEAHSPVSSPGRTVGVQPGSLSSPRKQKERWTRTSSRLTITMWWFCGISGVLAPKACGSTERCLGSTHFEKASSLAPRFTVTTFLPGLAFCARVAMADNRIIGASAASLAKETIDHLKPAGLSRTAHSHGELLKCGGEPGQCAAVAENCCR